MRKINLLESENPDRKMWDTYIFLENEPSCKSLLMEHYKQQGITEDAHRLAFQNTDKVIYLIKQAREYYLTASTSHILVKPLLLYYGMVSLVKALLLTHDPYYPRHTRLLKHGVTTKKLKPKNYRFRDDEIRIQKEGLFPLFLHLISEDRDYLNKYRVQDLLALLPEVNKAYQRLYEHQTMVPVHLSNRIQLEERMTTLYLPDTVLDTLHVTYSGFISFLNRYNTGSSVFSESHHQTPRGIFQIQWEHPKYVHVNDSPNGFENRLFMQDYKGNFYFLLIHDREKLLPEETIHLMLMYVLGMLCRYETDLWGDLIFSFASEDMYIINEFLQISARKFPNLILNLLMQEKFIFGLL